MIEYKNLSSTVKTFYGVKFRPGESRFVPGPINHKKFIRISVSQEPPKITKLNREKQVLKSPAESDESVNKKEETKKIQEQKKSADNPSKTNKSSPETNVKKEEN